MKKRIASGVLSLGILMGLGLQSQPVNAVETNTNEKNISYVYGSGLNESEVQETASMFEVDNLENIHNYSVNGDDLVRYLNYSTGNDSAMISSVLVEETEEDSGVDVVIETPENISEITEEDYRNAAITAGVEDVTISVASVRPVTGESALTGVYKAIEQGGGEVDLARTQLAQEELTIINNITQTLNIDQSVQLNQVIVEVKQELNNSEVGPENGLYATQNEIRDIIETALADHSLESVVSEEQINQLTEFFDQYQQTDAVVSEETKEQLDQLAGDLQNRFDDLWNRAEESGLIDQVVNFFRQVVNQIRNLISNI